MSSENREMDTATRKAAEKFYKGFWGILTKWFRVPEKPPILVTHDGTEPITFKPSEGYLDYMKFTFWLGLMFVDVLIAVGWLFLVVAFPLWGILLFIPALALMIIPDLIAYLAIHLKYDSTWYVMTQRSLRIRRGIWIISEMTLTFENIQNVSVSQGPLQRHFNISDIVIETAGGGGGSSEKGDAGLELHQGRIEGVRNAQEIRDQILNRLKTSKSAGLGDDRNFGVDRKNSPMWTPEHVKVLKEIRELCV
ncbi:PH domain-containing protein [bacterium]|nr:PH domain-containing protein [bacterium]